MNLSENIKKVMREDVPFARATVFFCVQNVKHRLGVDFDEMIRMSDLFTEFENSFRAAINRVDDGLLVLSTDPSVLDRWR